MDEIRVVIRKNKTLIGPFPTFSYKKAPECPHDLFLEWFQEAIDYGVHEPHAICP